MSKRVIMQNVQYTTTSKKVKVRNKRSVIFFRRASGDHNSLRLELTKWKLQRVTAFKTQIPLCKKCLNRRSVSRFKLDSYNNVNENILFCVESYHRKFFLCLTRDHKLKKKIFHVKLLPKNCYWKTVKSI